MATLAQKIEAERRIRDLFEKAGLPQPEIEYGFTCIRAFIEEFKIVVVIDIDEPEALPAAGES